jgi:hypothetical protein
VIFIFIFFPKFPKSSLDHIVWDFSFIKNGEFCNKNKIKSLVETFQQIVYSKEQSFFELKIETFGVCLKRNIDN